MLLRGIKLNFVFTNYYTNVRNVVDIYPSVILSRDYFDDNGYKTLFKMRYYDENKKEHYIGEIKVLHETDTTTYSKAPKKFSKLPESYCSLGQSISYYKNLLEFGENIALEILKGLRDVSIDDDIYREFIDNEGFNDSLIRFSEAEKALKEASLLFEKIEIQNNFVFSFSYKLENANEPHVINFNFSKDEILPSRINALVGKNGTGKTQILAKIAAIASGYEKSRKNSFSPERPPFSKIIAISYSVFDDFDRPKESDKTFSYKYCGIRDSKNRVFTSKEIKERIQKNINTTIKMKRKSILIEVFKEIFEHKNLKEVDKFLIDDFQLSSGQNILLMTLTDILVTIEEESLLLFDEPENHLHPNAISNLINMINKILTEFNSYAIISTHSPIIVQEIPSKFINVIERIDNIPLVRNLHIESFGENLSDITEEVFDVKSTPSNYKEILNELRENFTYGEIINLFGGKLSFNARIYLKSMYQGSDEE